MDLQNNQLITYPIPEGAPVSHDYQIRIRPLGAPEWTKASAYRVNVDMHDVRASSMLYFDFTGAVEVEVTMPGYYEIYRVDIRPLSLGIKAEFQQKTLRFILDRPVNISVEVNKERFHNLHIFAGKIEGRHTPANELVLEPCRGDVGFAGDAISAKLSQMPKGRTLRIKPGFYYISESIWHLPSDTNICLEGGAVLVGGLAFEHGRNLHIYGKGILYLADFARFSSINGIRLCFANNVVIEDLCLINPPHYSIYLGSCKDVTIRGIKSFSCEGWSDGIDMMSCRNVLIEHCFLRTSDDCIAIYGSRWEHYGSTTHIRVRNCTLWADVAHPTLIGAHGDHAHEGDVIEDIVIEDIDVLEHHEYQSGCLGVCAICAGDQNRVRNVTYRNFRIEPFEHGQLFHFEICKSEVYNPAPGHEIGEILLENISVMSGNGEEPSLIKGYSDAYRVHDITFRNIMRDGIRATSLQEANICVGDYAEQIKLS
ncbi:MAG: hypothetical protein K6G23_03000 [Lachnospiraceae bacterium]|nr:hypothetical protein [Lachnospiraceae bacterium]